MNALIRIAIVVAFVAVAGLACGSSGARAAESQSAASDFLKGLSKMAAKQTFTGTVVVTDSAAGEVVTDDQVIGKSTTKTSLNHSVTLTVTTNGVVANVTYSLKSLFEQELRYQYHKVVGSKTEETIASGHADNGSVTVDLRSKGLYQINFSGGGVAGTYRMVDTAVTTCTDLKADPTCRPGKSTSEDSGKPTGLGGVSGSVDGKLSEKEPHILRGSTVQKHQLNDGSTATRTVTWNLSRSQP